MKAFPYSSPTSVEEAVALLASQPGARLLAGGTDLLPLMRRQVVNPDLLVSTRRIPGLDRIRDEGDGALWLGARVRLSQVAGDPMVKERFPLLAEAAEAVGTPQVRNAGTVAGNLCQRPRCHYFRHPDFSCARRGGVGCPALAGQNRYHAVFGVQGCAMVHPSDLASALVALDAEAHVAGPDGEGRLPLEMMFAGPEVSRQTEHVLQPAQMITGVRVPAAPAGTRGVFLKVSERRVADFAAASVAATVSRRDGDQLTARVVLGGVAPTPLRRRDVEAEIEENGLSGSSVERAAEVALSGARPLAHNAYKVKLVAALVRRGLTQLAAPGQAVTGEGESRP